MAISEGVYMTTSAAEDTHQTDGDRRPHTVQVTVNNQPVGLPDRELTGLKIKQIAIEQGVAIQPNFQLSVKHGNRYEVVGDTDTLKVHRNQEFLAVAPDDNS
ncbi:multiubiquitin domain-containing protein [Dactylosporangium sp. AC04546]|uniref:multiubiquitin domain-containing protein n=1 Tax=Dactylosporangium sp. AC04546 TaxID=2862460 RepID=UPI001EDE485B|nr:multiubiquitin domain-containing protein [Dactylosporangium sp. AC04546]WVK82334.1 multiubiquitin domain-containing protein [Dactylosporangium sp. AC04546]